MKAKTTVVGAIVWAMAFPVSAVALKGNPAGDWVEDVLLVDIETALAGISDPTVAERRIF